MFILIPFHKLTDTIKNNGIKYLAITDHYLNDGTDIEKKNETARIVYAERINYHEKDIKIIAGAEFNLNQNLYERVR